jgi:hypothetical protein
LRTLPALVKRLDFLCAEGVLNTGLAERMRQWRHSGFSVHNRIRTQAADAYPSADSRAEPVRLETIDGMAKVSRSRLGKLWHDRLLIRGR